MKGCSNEHLQGSGLSDKNILGFLNMQVFLTLFSKDDLEVCRFCSCTNYREVIYRSKT